jgi:UDP-glucose 4-epimerase
LGLLEVPTGMELFPGERVLATGGTGVIGAWVVRELIDAGFEPIVLTRGMTKTGVPLFADRIDRITFTEGDINEPWTIVQAIQRFKPAGIVHMASAKPWQIEPESTPYPNPIRGLNSIVMGTANVLEAARQFDIKRVVFAGSKASYDAFSGEHTFPTYRPVSESYPSNPTSMYGIGKRAAELTGQLYRDKLGVDFVGARFASTYGPYKRGAGDHPGVWLRRAAEGEDFTLALTQHNYAERRDDFVFNQDVARGMVKLCTAARPSQLFYNLGTGIGHSAEERIELIETLTGRRIPVKIVAPVDPPVSNGLEDLAGVYDVSAAQRDLQFTAEYDLASGFAKTLEMEAR